MERTRRARCIEYSQRDVAKNKRRCVSPRRLLGNESLRIVFTRSCGVTSNVSRFILKYETERCSTSEEFASSSSGEIRIDRADPPSNTRSFKLFSSAREIRIYDTRMSREFLTELLRPRRAESIPLPDRERERETVRLSMQKSKSLDTVGSQEFHLPDSRSATNPTNSRHAPDRTL